MLIVIFTEHLRYACTRGHCAFTTFLKLVGLLLLIAIQWVTDKQRKWLSKVSGSRILNSIQVLSLASCKTLNKSLNPFESQFPFL